ncbi:MAG: pimeloyl-ACP methyl ester carboxylesterase [Patiriisocius sp.]|jgi:pimeloyl-ACP methyl ester carboxylesterase
MTRLLMLLWFLLGGVCQAEPSLNYLTVEGADGGPLGVFTAGNVERPAIVFIHGIGQSYYSFHKQLKTDLAGDFYLVNFNLRGHGTSGKSCDAEAYTQSAIYARLQDNQDLVEAMARLPVLLAVGADDNAGTLKDAALSEAYPNINQSVYTGVGHSGFYEQPTRFNAELRSLARTANH